MLIHPLRAISLASLLIAFALQTRAAAPATPQGAITAREYLNLGGGTAIADLTNSAKFPNSPDVVDYSPRLEWPTGPDDSTPPPGNVKNNYGVQIIGYFYPDTTGPYTFYISADDNARLYLSTDSDPANKKLIALESAWSPVRTYDSSPGGSDITAKNSSTYAASEWPGGGSAINLVAGRPYYIEALMKEGGGGDNLSVSLDALGPIPGTMLSTIDKTTGPVTIVTQPQNQTVGENLPATFTVEANGTPPYTYQWQSAPSAGGTFTDIVDATSKSYTIPAAALTDNGTQFRVVVTGQSGSATSNPATLTVSNDTTPPTIVSLKGSSTFTTATLVFSEPVTQATAEALGNYSFGGTLNITAATLVNPTTVRLTTAKQAEGGVFTLTVNGIKDASVAANTIAANSQATLKAFVFSKGFASWERWQDQGDTGNIDTFVDNLADPNFRPPDLTGTSLYLGSPRGVSDNYGLRAYAWFMPPVNGNYVFFFNCDDHGYLFLSTDADPANKKKIAAQNQWGDQNQWIDPDTTDNRSDQYSAPEWPDGNTISLTAGTKYYFELVFQEGGGGDGSESYFKLELDPDPANGTQPNTTGAVIGVYADPTGASVNISQQPQSVTILENATATFSVVATGSSSTLMYQWQKAPAAGSFTDIAGASSSTYTTPPIPMSENGSRYRVVITVPGLSTNSAEATVTVNVDQQPPTIVAVRRTFADDTKVVVVFSEVLDAASANTSGNYTINNGIGVTSAVLQADRKSVLLTTSPIAKGTSNTLTVSGVKDAAGNPIAASSTAPVTFQRGALFVVNNTDPPTLVPSDSLIQARLEARGYFVEVVGSIVDDASMADGKDLVLVSSTITSGNVTDTYKDVSVPVIEWEQAIQDDMLMTTQSGTTDRGTTTGLTTIEIVDPTHPMAAGFPAGNLVTVTAPSELPWGQPPASAKVVARLPGTQNATIYGYDKGALLADGTSTAAERRVLFSMTDNVAAVFNDNGWKLFDAAVDWAQNLSTAPTPAKFDAPAIVSAGSMRISWTGTGTLQESTSVTGGWTASASQLNPQNVSTTGPQKFYRIVTP